MRRFLRILILLLILVGGAWLLLRLRASPARAFMVSFGGFTNDTAGERQATFCVSNCGPGALVRWGHYGTETRQIPWTKGVQRRLGPQVLLRPGQAEVICLPAPTNAAAWKAVLFFSRDGWRYRWNFNTNSLLKRVTTQGVSMPTEVWQSEWFDQ